MKTIKWMGLSLALIGLGFSANAQSSMDTRVGISGFSLSLGYSF